MRRAAMMANLSLTIGEGDPVLLGGEIYMGAQAAKLVPYLKVLSVGPLDEQRLVPGERVGKEKKQSWAPRGPPWP